MEYTMEQLTKVNGRFVGAHYNLNQDDLNMVNNFSAMIENSRTKEMPKAGDIVKFTDEFGEFYPYAHIETIDNDGEAYICESASSYFCPDKSAKDGFRFSSSGGAWQYIPVKEMKYVGTDDKTFWHFGHCGACADGGIDFRAKVNVWEYSENKEKYSTQTHDRFYLSYSDIPDNNYHYFVRSDALMGKFASEDERELQKWLRTFRCEINPDEKRNGTYIWAYKNVDHHVSPKEFEALDAEEDTMRFNGEIMRCKRIYDDENTTVHTYFVWYWDDPTETDFEKSALKQNEIRNKYYTLDWWTHKENELAEREFETGKAEPMDISFLRR